MPQRESYNQRNNGSDYKPEQRPHRIRSCKPNYSSSEYQPDKRVNYKYEITIKPAGAKRQEWAHSVHVGEIHKRVTESTEICQKEDPSRSERSPEKVSPQPKPSVDEHQHDRQRCSKYSESQEAVGETAMV